LQYISTLCVLDFKLRKFMPEDGPISRNM